MYNQYRPVRITLLALLILFFAILNGWRLAESIYLWKTLLEYGARPLYLAVTGMIWLAAGLLLVWGLWRGISWAWLASIIGTLAYAGWYWIDRLFLQQPHSNGTFSIITTVVMLVVVFIILLSGRARQYLRGA